MGGHSFVVLSANDNYSGEFVVQSLEFIVAKLLEFPKTGVQ